MNAKYKVGDLVIPHDSVNTHKVTEVTTDPFNGGFVYALALFNGTKRFGYYFETELTDI